MVSALETDGFLQGSHQETDGTTFYYFLLLNLKRIAVCSDQQAQDNLSRRSQETLEPISVCGRRLSLLQ